MPKNFREVLGVVAGAVAAFIAYKLIFSLLNGFANETVRVLLAGVSGVIVGVAAMYLILRGQKDES